VQAGDAADAEDSVRGNLNATGLNGAEVTVSAKARNVIASAGGVTETVGGSNAVTQRHCNHHHRPQRRHARGRIGQCNCRR
jgi:hypothetical protein